MNKTWWKDRHVFITGQTGFKGSWLCMMLLQAGAKIAGYSDGSPTDPALFELAHLESNICCYWGDIRDTKLLETSLKYAQPNVVIHLAAQAIVKDGFTDPRDTFEINTIGTLALLEACKNIPSIETILIVTTDKVYGEHGNLFGYRETDPIDAADPYSTSKACAELITKCYRQSYMQDKRVATARAGNVIGGGDFAYRVIPMTMESLMRGEKPVVWDPLARRPWQSVLDCLNGYLTLIEFSATHKEQYDGSWNFGPSSSKDCKEVKWVVSKICDLWENGIVRWEVVECPVQYNLGIDLVLDSSKSNQILHWTPKWDLEHTLTNLVSWYRMFQRGDNVRDICEGTLDNYGN